MGPSVSSGFLVALVAISAIILLVYLSVQILTIRKKIEMRGDSPRTERRRRRVRRLTVTAVLLALSSQFLLVTLIAAGR